MMLIHSMIDAFSASISVLSFLTIFASEYLQNYDEQILELYYYTINKIPPNIFEKNEVIDSISSFIKSLNSENYQNDNGIEESKEQIKKLLEIIVKNTGKSFRLAANLKYISIKGQQISFRETELEEEEVEEIESVSSDSEEDKQELEDANTMKRRSEIIASFEKLLNNGNILFSQNKYLFKLLLKKENFETFFKLISFPHEYNSKQRWISYPQINIYSKLCMTNFFTNAFSKSKDYDSSINIFDIESINKISSLKNIYRSYAALTILLQESNMDMLIKKYDDEILFSTALSSASLGLIVDNRANLDHVTTLFKIFLFKNPLLTIKYFQFFNIFELYLDHLGNVSVLSIFQQFLSNSIISPEETDLMQELVCLPNFINKLVSFLTLNKNSIDFYSKKSMPITPNPFANPVRPIKKKARNMMNRTRAFFKKSKHDLNIDESVALSALEIIIYFFSDTLIMKKSKSKIIEAICTGEQNLFDILMYNYSFYLQDLKFMEYAIECGSLINKILEKMY